MSPLSRRLTVIVASMILIAALTALTRLVEPPAVTPIAESDLTLVVRTDFSDDAAWRAIRAAIEAPVGDCRAYVQFLSDPAYAGLTPAQVVERTRHPDRTFLFVVDRTSLGDPEHPILVLDVSEKPARSFRVIPSEMWSVQNNLSIANMDFEEFAAAVGSDGVFRGFRKR